MTLSAALNTINFIFPFSSQNNDEMKNIFQWNLSSLVGQSDKTVWLVNYNFIKKGNDENWPSYFVKLSGKVTQEKTLLYKVTRWFGKKLPNFLKSSQNSCQDRKVPKYLHQSSIWKSKVSKWNQFWSINILCFKIVYRGKNVKKCSPKCYHFLRLLHFQKRKSQGAPKSSPIGETFSALRWVSLCWMKHLIYCYAECHDDECRFAKCLYAQCCGTAKSSKVTVVTDSVIVTVTLIFA